MTLKSGLLKSSLSGVKNIFEKCFYPKTPVFHIAIYCLPKKKKRKNKVPISPCNPSKFLTNSFLYSSPVTEIPNSHPKKDTADGSLLFVFSLFFSLIISSTTKLYYPCFQFSTIFASFCGTIITFFCPP